MKAIYLFILYSVEQSLLQFRDTLYIGGLIFLFVSICNRKIESHSRLCYPMGRVRATQPNPIADGLKKKIQSQVRTHLQDYGLGFGLVTHTKERNWRHICSQGERRKNKQNPFHHFLE